MPRNISIVDGDLRYPTPAGPKRWIRPFDDSPQFYVYEQDFQQLARFFAPAVDYPAEVIDKSDPSNVPNINSAIHRCVEEGPLVPIGAGIVQWTRTYARTPQPRYVYESFAWRRPGVATEAEAGLLTINQNLTVQRAGSGTTKIVTTTAHNAEVGDLVGISFNVRIGAVEFQRSRLRTVLTTPTISEFTVNQILDNIVLGNGVPQWRFVKVGLTRVPTLKTVRSRRLIEYFAIGEAGLASPDSIPIDEVEQVLTADGEETDTYSATTTPTGDEYLANSGNWIVAEDSIIRQWKGHIYEKSTRYVICQ